MHAQMAPGDEQLRHLKLKLPESQMRDLRALKRVGRRSYSDVVATALHFYFAMERQTSQFERHAGLRGR